MAFQCDCLGLVLFLLKNHNAQDLETSHKVELGVMERGNLTYMLMECSFKTDSQERDTRISLVEEEIGSIECSPSFMPGLA